VKKYLILLFVLSLTVESETILKTFPQIAPPKYIIKGKEIKGICAEIIYELNKVLKKEKIRIILENHPENLEEILKDLEENRIQIFVGLAKSEKRLEKFIYSDMPIYRLRQMLIMDSQYKNIIPSKKSFSRLKIGVISSTVTSKKIPELISQAEILPISNFKKALYFLKVGKIDGILYNSISIGYKVNKSSRFYPIFINSEIYSQYIVFSSSTSKETIKIINKCLKKMLTSGVIEKIIRKYSLEKYIYSGNKIFLGAKPIFCYQYIDNGKWKGINIEKTVNILKKYGYKPVIQLFPYKRSIYFLKKKALDGVIGISEKSAKSLSFLPKVLISKSSYVYVYLNSQNKSIHSIKDIPYGICGYLEGYEPNKRYPNLKYVCVNSSIAGFKLLSKKRLDFFYIDKNILFHCKSPHDNIKLKYIEGNKDTQVGYYIIFSNSYIGKKIAKIFNNETKVGR